MFVWKCFMWIQFVWRWLSALNCRLILSAMNQTFINIPSSDQTMQSTWRLNNGIQKYFVGKNHQWSTKPQIWLFLTFFWAQNTNSPSISGPMVHQWWSTKPQLLFVFQVLILNDKEFFQLWTILLEIQVFCCASNGDVSSILFQNLWAQNNTAVVMLQPLGGSLNSIFSF